MATSRMRRVNEVMREVLGTAISSELQDPRIGFVTVTSVDTSPDLRHARVYVSVLGSEGERERTLSGLRSAHGPLQSAINSELRLKRTPALSFEYDETVERADRITRMLATDEPAGRGARMSDVTTRTEEIEEAFAATVERLRTDRRFLLTTHEGPDGDALGSLLALHGILTQLGQDAVMFLAEKEFPLPVEYRFMPLQEVFHEPPADLADRTIVFLDCGNIDRMPVDWLRDGGDILNIDHHHDNTRFGTVNLVDDSAACTAEIIFEIAADLGAEITPEIATALYVGLITDTGMFMYENTDARSHRVAAALIDAGVEVNEIYRRLYERMPQEKLRLLARSLERVERRLDGALSFTYVSAEDYAATGADEGLTEGIIDFVRALEGTAVAAVIRDKPNSGGAARKASLRSTDGVVDVSEIARKMGGGGHRRAAGFSTDLDLRGGHRLPAVGDRRAAWLTPAPATAAGFLLVDKPAGRTSHQIVAEARRQHGLRAGHAGTLDPFATGLLVVLLGQATRLQRYVLGLPKTYLATARLGWRSTTGDPEGELTETGVLPSSARAADRAGGAAGPADLGRPGRRRAPLQTRPPRRAGRRAARARGRDPPRRARLLRS